MKVFEFYFHSESDMAYYMVKIAQTDQPLTVEERNLLSIAFKNILGAKRESLRILGDLEKIIRPHCDWKEVSLLQQKQQVESELHSIATDLIRLVEQHLTPNGSK